MEREAVIEAIEEPTVWRAPLTVVPKKNVAVRICIDYTELNKYVPREKLVLPSVEESLTQLEGAKLFSLLDASNVPLLSACTKLTTFITPVGRYFFKRLPFGINGGPEHNNSCMDQKDVVNQADDIPVCDNNK